MFLWFLFSGVVVWVRVFLLGALRLNGIVLLIFFIVGFYFWEVLMMFTDDASVVSGLRKVFGQWYLDDVGIVGEAAVREFYLECCVRSEVLMARDESLGLSNEEEYRKFLGEFHARRKSFLREFALVPLG